MGKVPKTPQSRAPKRKTNVITSKIRMDIMGKKIWTFLDFLELDVRLLFRFLIRYCWGRGTREPCTLSPDLPEFGLFWHEPHPGRGWQGHPACPLSSGTPLLLSASVCKVSRGPAGHLILTSRRERLKKLLRGGY